jgi:hypothetical protein
MVIIRNNNLNNFQINDIFLFIDIYFAYYDRLPLIFRLGRAKGN